MSGDLEAAEMSDEEERQHLISANGFVKPRNHSASDPPRSTPPPSPRAHPSPTPRPPLLVSLAFLGLCLAVAVFSYRRWPAGGESVFPADPFTVAAPSSFSAPTPPSGGQGFPVCSAEGQQLWAARYEEANYPPKPLVPPVHWSSVDAVPPVKENPFLWTINQSNFRVLDPVRARSLAVEIADMVNKLMTKFLLEPFWDLTPSHPWWDWPPFPFPSISRTLPEATRHPFPPGIVPVPNHNKSHPAYVEGGARIPLDYDKYKTDAELLYATWPGCFESAGGWGKPTVDVKEFLAEHSKVEAAKRAELMTPLHLNSLPLTLNFKKFPPSEFPPAGVPSIPLVVTTIDSQKFRDKMRQFAAMMRKVIGIHDSTVFINMEKVKVETLQLMAKHFDFARIVLSFTPVDECFARKPYEAALGKDFKINLALLYSFHIVYNVWDYDYAVVVEDDMDPSRDVYLYHLAVSAFANQSPDVFTVASTSTSRFYDCFHLPHHLTGQFDKPNIYDSIECVSDGQTIGEDDLVAFNFTTSNLLAMERIILPWACGYTRKYYAYILNFFLTFTGSMGWQRYDITAHRIFSHHPYMRALVPMTDRVHGDPVFMHRDRRWLPLLTACQHTEWEVVAPAPYRQKFSNPRVAYYDTVV